MKKAKNTLLWKCLSKLLISVCLLLISGCNQGSQPTVTVTSIDLTKALTNTPSMVKNPLFTDTPIPTETQTKFPTNTLSSTPLPTLPLGEAKKVVQEMIETNGDCQFPCWWGLVPGENNIEEAINLLMPLALNSKTFNPFQEGSYGYSFSLPIEDNPIDMNTLWVSFIVNSETKIIEMITTSQDFTIQSTVEMLGLPDQIYIQASERIGIGPGYYEILVLYKELGILADITGESELSQENGEDFTVLCHDVLQRHGRGEGFFFWSTRKPTVISEILNNPVDDFPPQPLQKVTNMTVEEFFELLVGKNTKNCLKIPMNNWGY